MLSVHESYDKWGIYKPIFLQEPVMKFVEMKLEAALESPALSVNEEVVAEVAQQLPDELSPKQVADAFVLQYYHILREYPDHVHKFYKDASIMSRLGSEGMMLSANTVQVSSGCYF